MPRMGAVHAELEIPDASMLGARVVVSPLLTLAMALMDAFGDRPPTPWRLLLRERARGLDSSPLTMFARPSFQLPNGLLPLPGVSPRTFEEELDALRAGSLEGLLSDLEYCWGSRELPEEMLPFAADPATALARYCNALEAHWERMVRPSWPRMQRLLEREVLLLGQRMALAGVDGALAGLHPGFDYRDHRLRYHAGEFGSPNYVAQPTLTLAPIACEPDLVLVNEDHPGAATVIAYAARGSAELWEEARRAPQGELAALLGPTRASVALALAVPSTTSELSDRLGLAPSTVSRHLTGLVDAGLADRCRRGPCVDYRLTARGSALLDLY
jgi:DNA-binding transcriptional ArsR family regulator